MTMTSASVLSRFTSEASALLRLAIPIIIAQLSMTGMSFVDTAMSGQASAQDLAAIAIGGSFWIPCFLIIRGLMMAITPTIAHLYGAQQYQPMAKEVQQGLWIGLVTCLLTMVFLHQSTPILSYSGISAELIPITDGYLKALSISTPAVCLFIALTCFCEGTSDTRPSMIISVIGLLINIPANYVLIYGKFGFPELGAIGCGWATALSFYVMAALKVYYVTWYKKTGIFSFISWPDLQNIKQLFRLGLPIAIALFVEGSIFAIIALIIGKLGAQVVASHQIALSFSSIAFMVPLSISFGLTIRIGQALGSGNSEVARFRAKTGYIVTTITGLCSAILMMNFARGIAGIYSTDALVITGATGLIIYAAIFQISDALQVCSAGILRGYKDTALPMIVVVIAYWAIGMPLGYSLGMTTLLTPQPMGADGFWIGLISGLTIAAIGLGARFIALSRKQPGR